MNTDKTVLEEKLENKKYAKRYNLNEFKEKIIDLLSNYENGLNINQISNIFEINRNTVSKYLKTLEATNTVISRKIGVATLWYNATSSIVKLPGPNIITIRKNDSNELEIVKTNKIYYNTISKIPEALIGSNLWDYYPFNQFKTEIEPFLLYSFQELSETNIRLSNKFEFRGDNYNSDLILTFQTHFHAKGKNLITIEYYDTSLLHELEKELLNTGSFEILMNMVNDEYISIQTDNYKVLKANKNVLNTFNNGKELSKEDVLCYDLYHKRDKPCLGCPAKEAMDLNKVIERDIYHDDRGLTLKYQVYPILSKNGMRGYILKIREIDK